MYNPNLSIEYAIEWALKRNPKYADFDDMGGDCTNFISQCLFAGGIEFSFEEYGWFYHSLNSRAPAWTGVDELFEFATKNQGIKGPKFKLVAMKDVEIGDIIQLFNSGEWTHTLIVSKIIFPINLKNILVCAHDDDSLNRSLSTYVFSRIRFCKVKKDA